MDDLTSRLRAQFEEQYKVQADGCWLWTGKINNADYGTMQVFGGYALAHRLSYELFVGPIPEGLVIDHLCRNRTCVNYEHLEPVTNQENLLRSPITQAGKNARQSHCPQGHPYEADNLMVFGGSRFCRECGRVRWRMYYQRKHGVAPDQRRGPYQSRFQPVARTHCRRGHPLDEDNVYYSEGTRRRCRTCHNDINRACRARKAQAVALKGA